VRIAKLILSPLWVIFAYFQLNDAAQYGNHDPWFWVLYYLATATLTALSLKWTFPNWLLPSAIGFSLGCALFRMQDAVGNFDFLAPFRATPIPSQMTKATQQPNEIGGLILVAIWLGIMQWHRIQSAKKSGPA